MKMHRRPLLGVIVLLLVSACDAKPGVGPFRAPLPKEGTDVGMKDSRPSWQRQAWQRIAKNDCVGAIDYLRSVPQYRTDAHWFTLQSQANLLCWQNGLGEQYKVAALEALNAGLASMPHSPRLLKSKAEYYDLTRDHLDAELFYDRAKAEATTLLSRGTPSERDEADQVLNELQLQRHGP